MCHGNFPITRLLEYLPGDMDVPVWDLGCGRGEPAYYIRAFSGTPFAHHEGQPYLVGFDKRPENVDWARSSGVYNEAYQRDLNDFTDWCDDYAKPNLTLLIDVAEHLESWRAKRLFHEIIGLSTHVLFSMPYKERHPGEHHLWSPDEKTVDLLRNLGLSVETHPYYPMGGTLGNVLKIYDKVANLPRELIAWR